LKKGSRLFTKNDTILQQAAEKDVSVLQHNSATGRPLLHHPAYGIFASKSILLSLLATNSSQEDLSNSTKMASVPSAGMLT